MTKSDKLKQIILPDRCFHVGGRMQDTKIKVAFSGELISRRGLLLSLQKFLKSNGRLYYTLLGIFSPVLLSRKARNKIRCLLEAFSDVDLLVNLGSGPEIFFDRKDVINIDIAAYNNVDLVASASDLPIHDATLDLVINAAMLEHASDPEKIVAEMLRVLKPGGSALIFVPFMQPFHAAPTDYTRWTHSGATKLVSAFSEAEIIIGAGPTSGLLWVFQHWVAIVFSFGIKPLHDLLFIIMMIFTSPLKFLDILTDQIPNAEIISSGFYIIAKK